MKAQAYMHAKPSFFWLGLIHKSTYPFVVQINILLKKNLLMIVTTGASNKLDILPVPLTK
jgi:hypothetical protein